MMSRSRCFPSFRPALSLFAAALYFAPLKLIYRIDTRAIRHAHASGRPVIYVICEQSKLDPVICQAILPEDTLHVLDPASTLFCLE